MMLCSVTMVQLSLAQRCSILVTAGHGVSISLERPTVNMARG